MPRPVRKKKLQTWEVIRLKASPAAFVRWPDKQTALKLAIEQFKVRKADQWRLLVRPR